jgi:hypothetical protein
MTQEDRAPAEAQITKLAQLVERLAGMVEANTVSIRRNREAVAKMLDLVERTVGREHPNEHEVPNLQPRKRLHDVPTIPGTPLERDFTGTYVGRSRYTPDHHDEPGEEPEESKDH